MNVSLQSGSETPAVTGEFEAPSETIFILNKANTLLSEYGLSDPVDPNLIIAEWMHTSGQFQISLESGVLRNEEYTTLLLVPLAEGVRKGTVMQLHFEYPEYDGGEVGVSYRQFEGIQQFSEFFGRNKWYKEGRADEVTQLHDGVLAWFEVGLALMETGLAMPQSTGDSLIGAQIPESA